MGISSISAMMCLAFTGVAGYLLIPEISTYGARAVNGLVLRARLREGLQAGEGFSSRLDDSRDSRRKASIKTIAFVYLEGGVMALSKPADAVLRIGVARKSYETIRKSLAFKGCNATVESLCQASLPILAICLGIVWIATGSLVAGIVSVPAIVLISVISASKDQEKHDQAVLAQLPDTMRAIGIYYGSGLTLVQAFDQVSGETPDPLGRSLKLVASDAKAGKSIDEALAALMERESLGEIAFLAVCLDIQQQTGGQLKPLLDKAARSVVRSRHLKDELRVKTAQSRLSARVVAVLPICIFLLMAIANPSYIVGFFSSGVGLAMFAAACSMELVGIVMVRKILNLDVG